MVALFSRQRLNLTGRTLPVALLAGIVMGAFTALLFALMPASFLENLAIDSGIAAVLPAAEPPLGLTARAVLILLGGGSVAAVGWLAVFLLLGNRTIGIAPAMPVAGNDMPVLRRADAHPDAPPRRPLSAHRDLGMPFLDVHAERRADAEATETIAPPVVQPLPQNLDLPLAAFDPAAMPEEPADWVSPPPPLMRLPRKQVYEAGERFETFALPGADGSPEPPHDSIIPPAPKPVPPITGARSADFDGSASIHALLDRLERGVGQREMMAAPPMPAPRPREETLEDALTSLRRLATRAG